MASLLMLLACCQVNAIIRLPSAQDGWPGWYQWPWCMVAVQVRTAPVTRLMTSTAPTSAAAGPSGLPPTPYDEDTARRVPSGDSAMPVMYAFTGTG